VAIVSFSVQIPDIGTGVCDTEYAQCVKYL